LRRELMLFGIDVVIIAPGAVKTPIWDKAEQLDVSVYQNSPFFPALQKIRAFMLQLASKGLPAERIAQLIATALTTAHPKTRYQIAPDPLFQHVVDMLPKRVVDKVLAKRLGLTQVSRL
jgi:short-subunit dehydrogenase